MTVHEIQELLDGTLSNQQAAELLHRLSVSPEKLSAFRQHIALQTALERDKHASGLTLAEDAAVWNAISGAAVMPSPLRPSPFRRAMRLVGGAGLIVVAGVVGYLLGTQTLGVRIAGLRPGLNAAVARMAPASGLTDHGKAPVVFNIPFAPTVIARANSAAPRMPLAQNNAPLAARATRPLPARGADAAMDMTSLIQPVTAARTPQHNAPDDNPAVASAVVNPEHLRRLPQNPSAQDNISAAPPAVRQFAQNGPELAFNERVGVITPKPWGVRQADPEFSYRNIDLSYRFGDGRVGVGARVAYGTFARVTLQQTAQESGGDLGMPVTVYEPRLQAQKGLWFEGFANYRMGVTDMLAVGVEASFGGSASYVKAGGDLYLVALLTKNIGLQIGGGVGNYWYDLSRQRADVLKGAGNVAVSADAQSAYHGTILEGRYGLFVRF